MEDLLQYENRDNLYQFLIDDFEMIKIDERYYPEAFGNFSVVLSGQNFRLSYFSDRSFLDVDIASELEPEQRFPLSSVKDFLFNSETTNQEENVSNDKRIRELNDFLKNNFVEISVLFSTPNYYETKKKINELLRKQFISRNPGIL